MNDTTGFYNTTHRKWMLTNVSRCEKCYNKNAADANLEMFLRFQIAQKLKIEDDNFSLRFQRYRGILFNLTFFSQIINVHNVRSELQLIDFFLQQKITLGVGFSFSILDEILNNTYDNDLFSIPIMKGGKMWQIVLQKLEQRDTSPIDETFWINFEPRPLLCFFCYNYPYDLYPGNFIVNQSILYMKSIIWTDKRRLHMKKNGRKEITYGDRTETKVIMYKDSNIIAWPFLVKATLNLQSENSFNALGNMAVFSTGEILISFLDMVIKKIIITLQQNTIINQIAELRKTIKSCYDSRTRNSNSSSSSSNIFSFPSIKELGLMYKYCRRVKKYEIFEIVNGDDDDGVWRVTLKSNKKYLKDKSTDKHIEIVIVELLKGETHIFNLTRNELLEILDWFKFPKSKVSVSSIISNVYNLVRRGEIDTAITQTSVLNKDFNVINDSSSAVANLVYLNNLDVHRIGRFCRNAPSNSFASLCGISCALQKVVPKDSKTIEPKKITPSEIGLIDLLNTPDTPRNCGLVLESTVDVVISTESMTCANDTNMGYLIISNFPDAIIVSEPQNLHTLDEKYIYLCANQILYCFPAQIPYFLTVDPPALAYVTKHYGYENYYRMTQYLFKVYVPCIELIRESNNFWVCTSFPKTIYKLHKDGLLYSAKELESFEKHPDKIKQYLNANADNNYDKDFFSLWIGENREFIHNIFGPSIRATPKPNCCHLPRVSHACSTSKNFIGILNNTHNVGNVHQKTLTAAYYAFKLNSNENVILPGYYPLILIAGGMNNPEDGIVVKKSSIERGLFLANSYETLSIKFNYEPTQSPPTFEPTIKRGQILRKGLQIGIFKNVNFNELLNVAKVDKEDQEEEEEEEKVEPGNKNNRDLKCNPKTLYKGNKHIDVFSPELQLIKCSTNGGFLPQQVKNKSYYFSVVWVGKSGDMGEPAFENVTAKDLRSMAFLENQPNYHQYRCEKIECINVKHMNHLKLNLFVSEQFTPTVGDKLQTPTSQKGVISEIMSDQDMPFVVAQNGECYYPDMIINPQFLKRQALDNIYITGQLLNSKRNAKEENNCPYMNSCFNYKIKDTVYYMKLGEKILTGRVVNPQTGQYFLKSIYSRNEEEEEEEEEPATVKGLKKTPHKYYYHPINEYVDENGFTCVDKTNYQQSAYNLNKIVMGSIYCANYFNVCNHKATQMMHSSTCDEVIRTDFSGTPIRGKMGGFSFGPQEQLSLTAMGAERLNSEITQLRSDFCGIEVDPVTANLEDDEDDKEQEEATTEFLSGSTTFKRIIDDFNLLKSNLSFCGTRHVKAFQTIE